MSMVEPKEVALRSGESLSESPVEQQGCTLTPIGDLKNKWKRSKVTETMNGNGSTFLLAEDVLENRGGILGSMNVATHHLALTGDLPKGKDQRCAACHGCRQQWTIDNHHEFRPVCSVCHDHVNCLRCRERTANAVRVWPAKTGIEIA